MDGKRNLFLAKRLMAGDEKAYDILMNSYYQRLCAYAQSLCHDQALADDIVQNVFVKIWVKRKKIIQTYLSRIICINPSIINLSTIT